MGNSVKDGTGSGKEWKINEDNRGEVDSVQASEEHHENEDNEKAWTGAFDAIDPTSSDDYFVAMKNTATEVRAVSRLTVSSTVAGILEVQRVTGTSVGGSGDEINSWTLGGADPVDFTFESGVDITGLVDAGVMRFVTLEANVERIVEFPQTIRLKTNQQLALLWTITTGILTGNVDFYEEG